MYIQDTSRPMLKTIRSKIRLRPVVKDTVVPMTREFSQEYCTPARRDRREPIFLGTGGTIVSVRLESATHF